MLAEELNLSTVPLNCTQNPQNVFFNVYIQHFNITVHIYFSFVYKFPIFLTPKEYIITH